MTYVKEQWLGPLLGDRPKGVRATDWLSFLFCLDTRHIAIVGVTKDIVLPAAVLDGGVHPIDGLPEADRRINKGDVVALRKDVTLGYFDVENGSSIWRVKDTDWHLVKGAFALPYDSWPSRGARHRDEAVTGVGGVS
jgi:hypothetical protein